MFQIARDEQAFTIYEASLLISPDIKTLFISRKCQIICLQSQTYVGKIYFTVKRTVSITIDCLQGKDLIPLHDALFETFLSGRSIQLGLIAG